MKRLFMTTLVAFLATLAFAGAHAAELTPEERKNIERQLIERSDEDREKMMRIGMAYEDPELKEYLEMLLKQVFPDKADQLNVYIARDISPNAFMMPNGTTFVTAGWLALMRSEAALVYVLGHEGSHYFGRDSVQRFNSLKELADRYHKLNRNQWHGLLKDQDRYSQERELIGDRVGIKALIDGGYSLNSAAMSFPLVMELRKAYWDESKSGSFIEVLGSHPSGKERFEQFQEVAKEFGTDGEGREELERYNKMTAEVSEYVLQSYIDIQRDEVLAIMLGDQKASQRYGALYPYYVAEYFRLTDSKEDDAKILPLLIKADSLRPDHASIKLALGRAYLAKGNQEFGKLYLEQFIKLADGKDPRAAAAEILIADDPLENAVTYSAQQLEGEDKVHTDLRNSISYELHLPTSWFTEEINDGNGLAASSDGWSLNLVALTHADPAEIYENFKRAAPENFDVMDMAELQQRRLVNSYGDRKYKMVGSRVVNVDGVPGIETTYEYNSGSGVTYRYVIVSSLYNGRVYDFEYRAPVRVYFDKHRDVFENMMATFRF